MIQHNTLGIFLLLLRPAQELLQLSQYAGLRYYYDIYCTLQ